MKLFLSLVACVVAPLSCTAAAGRPQPAPPPPSFGFSPVLGDYMVLQQSPAAAAVYGVAPESATGVTVTVTDSEGMSSYNIMAKVGKDATHQPNGYVDSSGANLPVQNFTWKAVLHPTVAGGDYTITAKCTGCSNATSATLAHVTFGDMWYCSGQSNMWLPVQYSFSRNETVAAIKAGKYSNIRGIFSPSATTPTTGKWKTARQAIEDGNETTPSYSLFDMGALCWYFAQELVERGVKTPIGIADTAIGGQRIEEFMNNESYAGGIACPDAINAKEVRTSWNGQLFAKQVMPFVDMTVKGWTWYQGENNMDNIKGNAAQNIGYSCKQRELVKGWRSIWSEVKGTTDPNAPFGIVTLASSGSEGGPNMGAMRLAQTAGYGVLPNPEIPFSFFAQAGDLEDAWGPAAGPCFSGLASQWECCSGGESKHPTYLYQANRSSPLCKAGTNGKPEICDPACAAAAGTPSEGGIHPRSKRPVAERLATSAYKHVYGGSGAGTGPTLSGCSLDDKALTIEFNTTLLAGETVQLNSYNSSLNNFVGQPPEVPTDIEACYRAVKAVCPNNLHNHTDCGNCAWDPKDHGRRSSAWNNTLLKACAPRPINNLHEACHGFFPAVLPLRGSLAEVLVTEEDAMTADASAAFCVEPLSNATGDFCPPWARGSNPEYNSNAGRWLTVDITSATATSVTIDLVQLKGKRPAAIRYSWGIFDCCNAGDPLLWISKPCDNPCPITSNTLLPANPFIAEIVEGKCSCVAPQVCS